MNLLYNLSISSYKMAVRLASGKNVKAAKMLKGQQESEAKLRERIEPGQEYIWVHASSLGEFEQGRPLIEKIKEETPEQKILLTFFSPSGYEIRKDYKWADIICYLPFDQPGNVKRFLDLVQPKMAIFIKYEFWGNYLQGLKERGVPTYLISAIFRPTQSFFKWWGGMFRNMLDCYTGIYVQDEMSRSLLEGIGKTNVRVFGDTRFDRVTDILKGCTTLPIVEAFSGEGLTMIIGSSWEQDENVVLPYLNEHKEIKLIIAPHEFDESRLKILMSKIEGRSVRYTQTTAQEATGARCLIIDCYGVLASAYRYGDVAYVGGGFGVGIHNINEAAVYGIPVMFGPKYHKFKEAHDMIREGGAFVITSTEDFGREMEKMSHDKDYLQEHGEKAKNYIISQLGATERIYREIFGK